MFAKLNVSKYNKITRMTQSTEIKGLIMIDIIGTKYLTEKEATCRYGYSASWFRVARKGGYGPYYAQVRERGRILYPVVETDEWFKKKLMEKE